MNESPAKAGFFIFIRRISAQIGCIPAMEIACMEMQTTDKFYVLVKDGSRPYRIFRHPIYWADEQYFYQWRRLTCTDRENQDRFVGMFRTSEDFFSTLKHLETRYLQPWPDQHRREFEAKRTQSDFDILSKEISRIEPDNLLIEIHIWVPDDRKPNRSIDRITNAHFSGRNPLKKL